MPAIKCKILKPYFRQDTCELAQPSDEIITLSINKQVLLDNLITSGVIEPVEKKPAAPKKRGA